LENKFFRISVDGKTGGIKSILDKTNNHEILNASKYNGNELIAIENLGVDEGEEFTDKWWRMGDNPAVIEVVESGPIRATIRIKGTIINSKFTQEISLYATLPRIDMKTTLNWDGQKQVQINAVYPFSIEQSRITYEVPFGIVEYGKENPYSKAIHPTIRATNNWIDISNNQMGVTLATDVTPFDTKDRNDLRFHDARHIEGEIKEDNTITYYNPDTRNSDGTRGKLFTFNRVALQDPVIQKTDFVIQPILLRSVYSCGDKNLYFTQQGEHSYRFSISTHKGALVPHAAVQSGWEHNSPFVVSRGQTSDGKLFDSQSFITVSKSNIIVSIFKQAEDGNGVVLRCYETDGLDTKVTIKFHSALRKAMMTNIIEEYQNDLPIDDNNITMTIGKYSIETIRLVFKENG
jgi:alpha-mannosidase